MAADAGQAAIAATTAGVVITGNVAGSVQVGNHNIQVHDNHGSIVFNRVEATRRRLGVSPPPSPPDPFIGRAAERRQLVDAIAAGAGAGRSVGACVSGAEGAGRSSLLKRVAADAARRDGVLVAKGFGEQGAWLTADDIAQLLFNGAWYTDPLEKVTLATARTELQQLDAVALVYDASLGDDDLIGIADVLPAGATLVSARAAAYGAGITSVPIGTLPRTEAVALLAARAGLAQADADAAALDRLCELLGDWPGALAIAGKAIAVRGLAPSEAAVAIEAVTPASSFEHAAEYERAYALAEPALDPNARRMLATAANMPGSTADPDMLRRILGDPTWFDDAAATLQLLGLLRLNSPRFRVAAGLRPALEGTGGADVQPAAIRDAYAAIVLSDLRGRPNDPAIVEAEVGGLIETLASTEATPSRTAAIVRAIDPYLVLHGLWGVAETALSAVARGGIELNTAEFAWSQHELGTLALVTGRRDAARTLLRRALELRTDTGDTVGAAYTQHNLDILDPPPIDHRDDPDDGGDDGDIGTTPAIGRALVVAAVAAIVILGLAGTVVLGGALGWFVTPSPTPTAAPSAEPSEPAESPSPSPSAPPSESPPPPPTVTPPPVTPPPLGNFRIVYRPFPTYELDWEAWTSTVTILAIGDGSSYTFSVDGYDPVTTNPAVFTIPGTRCDHVHLGGSVTSPGFNPEPIDVTVWPPQCGTNPNDPVPQGPKLTGCSESASTLPWIDGGGQAPRRFELIISYSPDNTEFVARDPLLIDGTTYEESFDCGYFHWTVQAVDALGQRSGVVPGPDFELGTGVD